MASYQKIAILLTPDVPQIGMFDRDQTGTISFDEFKHLWKYVTDWLNWYVIRGTAIL